MQLSGFSSYPDGSPTLLIRISGVLLYLILALNWEQIRTQTTLNGNNLVKPRVTAFKWVFPVVLHTIVKIGRVSQTQLVNIRVLLLRSFIHTAYLRKNYTFWPFFQAIIRLIAYPIRHNYTILHCIVASNRIYDQLDDGLDKGRNM
jgi:hypothetical protein